MTSVSWIVAQSEQFLKENLDKFGQQKFKDNIHSKSIITRRLKFVRPKKPCNAQPMSSSCSSSLSSTSSTPPRISRQRSDFNQASRQLYEESKIPALMNWKSLLTSACSNNVGSGLRNLGNSCFMNATLQCLCYTPAFQNYIATKEHSKLCNNNGYCVFCELQKLMPEMLYSSSTSIPSRIFRHLRLLSKTLRPGRQEDAQEFLRYLMDGLQTATLKQERIKIKDQRIQETTAIHKIWGGYLRSQIKCCKCGYESNTYDAILDISLEIRGPSVRSAFKHFTDPEILDDDNKYFCENCKKKRRAIKQFTIFEAPNILVLHLKRFESSSNGLSGGKINKYVKFTQELDITEYMSYDIQPKVSYNLFAILIHHGYSSHGGHYVSYIKSFNNNWYLMDDSRVEGPIRNINNLLKEKAYLLFYKRNENKVLYQSPDTTPIKTYCNTNNNKTSIDSFDRLQDIADALPKNEYLFKKKRKQTGSSIDIKRSLPLNHDKLRHSSEENTPKLNPLKISTPKSKSNVRRNTNKLITSKQNINTKLSSIKSSKIIKQNPLHHSTRTLSSKYIKDKDNQAQEWQKKDNMVSGEKRKIPADVLPIESPSKKRRIMNGNSIRIVSPNLNKDKKDKLKLLKRKIFKTKSLSLNNTSISSIILSPSTSSNSSSSVSPSYSNNYSSLSLSDDIRRKNAIKYLRRSSFGLDKDRNPRRGSIQLQRIAKLRLQNINSPKKATWIRKRIKRPTQMPLAARFNHPWNRSKSMSITHNNNNIKSISLSDSSSESVLSDNNNINGISSASSSLSPKINNKSVTITTTLPTNDGTSPRTLPISINQNINNTFSTNNYLSSNTANTSITQPKHHIKNIIKSTNILISDPNEINSFLNNKSSQLSAIGISNVGLWSDDINIDFKLREYINKESSKPLMEPKDEWDLALDTNQVYPHKSKQKSNPWKEFNRNNNTNQFQMKQNHNPQINNNKFNKFNNKKKKNNRNRYHQRRTKILMNA